MSLISICLFGDILSAQDIATTASLSGIVRDDLDSSYTIPNVDIYLKKSNGQLVAKTSTDFKGYYLIDNLKPGKYYLECQSYGYYSIKVWKPIHFVSGDSKIKDLEMRDKNKEPPRKKWKDVLSMVPAAALLLVGMVALF